MDRRSAHGAELRARRQPVRCRRDAGAVWPFVSGHALSVALAGTGLGSVTGDGISCSPTCAQAYADGTSVSLIATASPASTFSGWSGGGCSGTGACTIQIAADTIVTATFSAQAPALTSLSITPRKFKLGGRLVKRHCVVPTHANRRRPRCRRPVGMKVSYELSLDATVTFTIAEKLRGRLVRGRWWRQPMPTASTGHARGWSRSEENSSNRVGLGPIGWR